MLMAIVAVGFTACGGGNPPPANQTPEANVFVDAEGMGYYTVNGGTLTGGESYADTVVFKDYTIQNGVYKVMLNVEPDNKNTTVRSTEFIALIKNDIAEGAISVKRSSKVNAGEAVVSTKDVDDDTGFFFVTKGGAKKELYVASSIFQGLKNNDVLYTEFTFNYANNVTKVFKLEITIKAA